MSDALLDLAWDETIPCWFGIVVVPGGSVIEVAVAGEPDAQSALAYARWVFPRVCAAEARAREFAGHELAEYYDLYQRHLGRTEQIGPDGFARRLHWDGLWIGPEGDARFDFRHDLNYPDPPFREGSLVVVLWNETTGFRHSSWITGPDADELRQYRRCGRRGGEPDD